MLCDVVGGLGQDERAFAGIPTVMKARILIMRSWGGGKRVAVDGLAFDDHPGEALTVTYSRSGCDVWERDESHRRAKCQIAGLDEAAPVSSTDWGTG